MPHSLSTSMWFHDLKLLAATVWKEQTRPQLPKVDFRILHRNLAKISLKKWIITPSNSILQFNPSFQKLLQANSAFFPKTWPPQPSTCTATEIEDFTFGKTIPVLRGIRNRTCTPCEPIKAKHWPISVPWPFASDRDPCLLNFLLHYAAERESAFLYLCPVSASLGLDAPRRINMSDEAWFIRAELFLSPVVGSLLRSRNEILRSRCQGQEWTTLPDEHRIVEYKGSCMLLSSMMFEDRYTVAG